MLVLFPCGAVVIDDVIYIYYGGADTVIGGCNNAALKRWLESSWKVNLYNQ